MIHLVNQFLLKNEGLPNEEVHTFSGEQYSIGRHQDNDIPIKGDTKDSRRHCKLFRRNGHFYIQDQHSSNGTLVNGELISERRLYGGEELKSVRPYFVSAYNKIVCPKHIQHFKRQRS